MTAFERLETLSDLVSHHLVGSAFSLTCLQPEPDSNSSIAWYYNNIPLCLQDSSERRDCNPPPGPSTDNGTLFFSAVRLDQAGWYTCSASSRALGRRETDFLVIIQGKGSFKVLIVVVVRFYKLILHWTHISLITSLGHFFQRLSKFDEIFFSEVVHCYVLLIIIIIIAYLNDTINLLISGVCCVYGFVHPIDCRGGGSTARLGGRELILLCGFNQYTLLQKRDNKHPFVL